MFTESKARGLRLTGLPLVGGPVRTVAGWALRRGFPPGPGRGRGGVLRTLWVVGAFPVPRGAAPRGPACPAGVPISPEKWGERGPGPSVIGRRFRWNRRRLAPATWVPARSRAGIQAFSRESPDAKSRGGGPPPPLFYGPLVPTRSFWRGGAQRGGGWAVSVPMYVP